MPSPETLAASRTCPPGARTRLPDEGSEFRIARHVAEPPPDQRVVRRHLEDLPRPVVGTQDRPIRIDHEDPFDHGAENGLEAVAFLSEPCTLPQELLDEAPEVRGDPVERVGLTGRQRSRDALATANASDPVGETLFSRAVAGGDPTGDPRHGREARRHPTARRRGGQHEYRSARPGRQQESQKLHPPQRGSGRAVRQNRQAVKPPGRARRTCTRPRAR